MFESLDRVEIGKMEVFYYYYYYCYYYYKRLAVQGWEQTISTLSVRRPQPHSTNPKNERIGEIKPVGHQKGASN